MLAVPLKWYGHTTNLKHLDCNIKTKQKLVLRDSAYV